MQNVRTMQNIRTDLDHQDYLDGQDEDTAVPFNVGCPLRQANDKT